MGCDIHVVAEYQQRESGKWSVAEGPLNVWRDYSVFSTLCGVRNRDVPAQIADTPRGYPPDVNDFTVKILDEDGVQHSRSWISGEEFKQFFPWSTVDDMSHFAIVGWTVLKAYDWTAVRFVFGFDN